MREVARTTVAVCSGRPSDQREEEGIPYRYDISDRHEGCHQ